MVKKQLWAVNSALVGAIMICIITIQLLRQDLPIHKPRRRASATLEVKTPRVIVIPEKIYQNDLFDTFSAPAETSPTAKNLVTPIPPLTIKNSSPPPTPPKVEFVPPLDITIKGLIMSSSPKDSMAVIADQTGKEQAYRVGDKINDGQILKITKNQVIIIRGNGQQETFYLRKTEKLIPGLSSWDFAIKKIDDQLYHLDPVEVTKEITSIGEVIEALDLCGAFENGKAKGMRVGSIKHHPLGEKLGFQPGDIITKINELPVTSTKERMAVYDTIAALPMGGYIHVSLLRGGSALDISYLLRRLEKPSPLTTTPDGKEMATNVPEDLFKLGKDAQRLQKRRRFEHIHRTQDQHDAAVADMRKKMLDDMRSRAAQRRVQ